MNKDELLRRLDSLETTPLDSTQDLLREITQIIETAGDDTAALNWALSKTAETVIKTREVEPQEKTKYYEMLMRYIVDTALSSGLNAGAEALKTLFDGNAEFYKRNLHDNNVEFPLTRERPLAVYTPVAEEECDCVKPGLTTTSKMGWTRCKILNISHSGAYTVRFANSSDPVTMSEGYWFAPLGSRTEDFEWRCNLKAGDFVDALDSKLVWLLSTITEVQVDQNGFKNVRVSFRYFD